MQKSAPEHAQVSLFCKAFQYSISNSNFEFTPNGSNQINKKAGISFDYEGSDNNPQIVEVEVSNSAPGKAARYLIQICENILPLDF